LSVYGVSKLGGERQVLNGGGAGIVLRTAWVYAAAGRNFALTMLRLMREKEQVSVVCDQIGSPTWAAGIATAIWALIEVGAAGGVYHWTDLGVASWYDFAVAIAEEGAQLGLVSDRVAVTPIATSDYPTPARRPSYSVLDKSSLASFGLVPLHWRKRLRGVLGEMKIV